MKIVISLVALGILCASAPTLIAQENQPDERVAEVLTELGYKLETTPSGNHKITVKVSPDSRGARTQLVIFFSNTYEYGTLEIREVRSTAMVYDDMPNATVLQRLLEDTAKKKFGAWEINSYESEGRTKYSTVFTAKIGANADASTVRATIQMVSESADEMETVLEKSSGQRDTY